MDSYRSGVMLNDLAFGWKRGWISVNKNMRDNKSNLNLTFTRGEKPKIAAYWTLRHNAYIRLHAIVHLYELRIFAAQYEKNMFFKLFSDTTFVNRLFSKRLFLIRTYVFL